MKLPMKAAHFLLICTALMSSTVFGASNYVQMNHFEGIGAAGIANVWAGNSHINVTSSETDRLVQRNNGNWGTFAAQLGAGYIYYFHPSMNPTTNVQWFPAIEPQLNYYYLGNNSGISGNVWRFNSANFNQLTYKIPVRSSRLMVDAALTVIKKEQSSLYVKLGVGNAWNRLSYSDTENGAASSTCPNQRISLGHATHSNFAWEAGAGVLHDFNNQVGMSLEYLYTNFGTVRSAARAGSGTITAPTIGPIRFNMQAQAVLLGLHVAV